MMPSVLGTSVPISKAIRQKLRSEIKRTGVTALMLLKDASDMPEGLTVAHVNRWASGILGAALEVQLTYVMTRWADLPNEAERVSPDGVSLPKRGKRYADGAVRIDVTEAMSKLLRAELARTGIDHATLLDGASDTPDGLNARIIRGWIYQDAHSADSRYWDFVVRHLASSPNFDGVLPPLKKPRRRD